MQELVKFTSDTGLDVQFSLDDVRNYICPNATDKELVMFGQLCQAQRLNPFTKDAYLIKYGNSPATMITGKEVFTKRANANENYEGFESGVTFIDAQGQVKQREGSAVYKAAGETLVGGWCRVHVKGRKPFYDEVTLDEYSTGKSGWAKMPATMIRKVALVHALREAFPDDFQGLYSHEEMGEAGALVEQQSAEPVTVEAAGVVEVVEVDPEPVEMISSEQQQAIFAMCEQLAKMRGKAVSEVTTAVLNSATLKGLGYANDKEQLTSVQADAAIKVLDNWLNKATEQAAAEQPEIIEASAEYSPEDNLATEDIPF